MSVAAYANPVYRTETTVPYIDLYETELRTVPGFPGNGNQKTVLVPYCRLFDGQAYQLAPGVHFHCSLVDARNLIYQAARRRRVRVRVSMCGDGLVVQARRDMGVPDRHRDLVYAVRQYMAAVDEYAARKSKVRHDTLTAARQTLERVLAFDDQAKLKLQGSSQKER